MTSTPIVAWLNRYDAVFSELQDGLIAAARSAGDVGRAIDAGMATSEVDALIAVTARCADDFLATVRRAQNLPPIPDPATERAFRRALALWQDGAQVQRDAALRRDAAELLRAGDALQAAGDETLRMAGALRRATGQPPDPRIPS